MTTRKSSAGLGSTARWVVFGIVWLSAVPAAFAAEATNSPSAPASEYAGPKLFTGTLYEMGSMRKKVIFTFRRTVTYSNSTDYVERQFFSTNGSVAAVENVVYDSGRLVSFQMQEFQAQVSGAVRIVSDPRDPARQQIIISYGRGLTPPKGEAQSLPPDIIFDDTVYPFMMAHWDKLMRGDAVKFHFIALEWHRTFTFRFIKTGESVENGRTMEQIRMESANMFVARLVNPLIFTVEKGNQHHILSYIGRTTPRVKKGSAWKYLDAETVFDWK